MTLSDSDTRVMLRGGFSTTEAVYLLLDLESLGVSIGREGPDLIVRHASRLAPAHRHLFTTQKADVFALLEYITRADLDAHLFTDGGPSRAGTRLGISA